MPHARENTLRYLNLILYGKRSEIKLSMSGKSDPVEYIFSITRSENIVYSKLSNWYGRSPCQDTGMVDHIISHYMCLTHCTNLLNVHHKKHISLSKIIMQQKKKII